MDLPPLLAAVRSIDVAAVCMLLADVEASGTTTVALSAV
jgi:hypothetical protein